MPAYRYKEENGSAAMLAAERSASVAPKVNLWEWVTPMPLPTMNKASHSRGDVIRSPKQGYQWPHRKDLCPSKIKKTFLDSFFIFRRGRCGTRGRDSRWTVASGCVCMTCC